MKRTLAYNRYPLVICTLGLLLGGLHSLFQLHQTPADTWTAAYLTAREAGTTFVIASHDRASLEHLCTKILRMEAGHLA